MTTRPLNITNTAQLLEFIDTIDIDQPSISDARNRSVKFILIDQIKRYISYIDSLESYCTHLEDKIQLIDSEELTTHDLLNNTNKSKIFAIKVLVESIERIVDLEENPVMGITHNTLKDILR